MIDYLGFKDMIESGLVHEKEEPRDWPERKSLKMTETETPELSEKAGPDTLLIRIVETVWTCFKGSETQPALEVPILKVRFPFLIFFFFFFSFSLFSFLFSLFSVSFFF